MKNFVTITITAALGMLGATALGQMPKPMEEHTRSEIPSTTANDPPRVILFTNGRILEGVITPHPEGGWNVQQKLGTIRVNSKDVEGIYSSLVGVYDYKREILPPRDIQERMRLYRWCMSFGLLKQSQEQLQAVLAISPDHEEAKSLLGQLETRMVRQEVRTDRQILQASASEASTSDSRDRDIDPAFLNRAMREMSLRNAPVIFDLPEPLALKRAQEFNQYIHPIVQRYCASCHNERTANGFPLVSAKGRAARDPAILRANLDATLSLVNQANLMQSPLLTNSLLPHQPNNQPIFRGPNDTAYRLLANWVSNLQQRGYGALYSNRGNGASETQTGLQPVGFGSSDSNVQIATDAENGFASEGQINQKTPQARDNLPIPLNPQVMQQSRFVEVPSGENAPPVPPGQLIPGSYNGAAPQMPKGTQFPVPLSSGGSPEDLLKQLQKEEAERDLREQELAKLNDRKPATAATEKPVGKPDASKPGAKVEKKSAQIDEKLLEQFILQRRGGGG